MSSAFGKSFQINRVVTGAPDVYYQMGGTIINATPGVRGDSIREAGTGQRRLALLKSAGVVPQLDFEMNIKRLDDYITSYAMISEEGVVPAHQLYYTDGVDDMGFTECKVDSCRILVRARESVKAEISVLAKDVSAVTLGTFLSRTEEPISWEDVTAISIGGEVTNWREFAFGVNNNVSAEFLGSGLMPSEVEEAEAFYSGYVLLSRKAASRMNSVKSGSKAIIAIGLEDHQSTPVTTSFTFTDALLKVSTVEVRGLGLELERIEWEGDQLSIT